MTEPQNKFEKLRRFWQKDQLSDGATLAQRAEAQPKSNTAAKVEELKAEKTEDPLCEEEEEQKEQKKSDRENEEEEEEVKAQASKSSPGRAAEEGADAYTAIDRQVPEEGSQGSDAYSAIDGLVPEEGADANTAIDGLVPEEGSQGAGAYSALDGLVPEEGADANTVIAGLVPEEGSQGAGAYSALDGLVPEECNHGDHHQNQGGEGGARQLVNPNAYTATDGLIPEKEKEDSGSSMHCSGGSVLLLLLIPFSSFLILFYSPLSLFRDTRNSVYCEPLELEAADDAGGIYSAFDRLTTEPHNDTMFGSLSLSLSLSLVWSLVSSLYCCICGVMKLSNWFYGVNGSSAYYSSAIDGGLSAEKEVNGMTFQLIPWLALFPHI